VTIRRTVLVTGGGKRLGAAIARALAAAGHRVVVHHNASGLEAGALAEAIGGVTVAGDLADLENVGLIVTRARDAAEGPIDGLVNSASAFAFDTPLAIDAHLYARLAAINGGSPVLLAAALADQADIQDGAVVNLLDQKIANPNPDFFSYSCAKFALAGATTMLAQALAPRVRVNAVSPGLTLQSGDQTDGQFAAVASLNLLRRPVGANMVAEAVTYLIGSTGINGQNLFVDCGQRFLPSPRDVMFEPAHG
jgi:NAD(P)-dependent dehydrogenase (short-subunit alcohol dehydrogenase family)